MTIDRVVPGARRALTAEELDLILARINTTETAEGLLDAAIRTVYDTLLSGTDYTVGTLPPELSIRAGDFAIPTSQWQTILAAVSNHAQRWGLSAELSLELAANWMPSTFEDPAATVPKVNLPERRPQQLELHVTREATDVIGECHRHVAALGQYFGTDSQVYQRAAETLLHHVCGLFSMGLGARSQVQPDGLTPLSLLVTTGSGLVYALIFHPQRRRCTIEDCDTLIDDHGTAHGKQPPDATDGHRHIPSYPLDAPRPGTWSVHS